TVRAKRRRDMRGSTKRLLRWFGLGAVAALLAVAAGCGGSSGGETTAAAPETEAATTQAASTEEAAGGDTAATGSGLGSEFDVASAGDVTLKLWWLGDLEAPGIEKWMDGMITAFEAKYPNVTIEANT